MDAEDLKRMATSWLEEHLQHCSKRPQLAGEAEMIRHELEERRRDERAQR